MKIVVVINPAAGQDEPVLAILNRVFREADVDYEVLLTSPERDAEQLVEAAVDQGADVVGVYGGDGTVAQATTGLRGCAVPLAILPGGTGNAVAQGLGVPTDLEAAARLAVEGGVERRIDAYESAGGLGLLRVGVGADARVVTAASRARKDQLGWGAYLLEAVSEFRECEPLAYRLDLDGERLECEATTCIVANIGRIGRGGLDLAEISPDDGLLDVLVIRRADWRAVLAVGASVLGLSRNDAPSDPDAPLQHYRVRHARIEASSSEEVHRDGDRVGSTPVEVDVVPSAVSILVPESDPTA